MPEVATGILSQPDAVKAMLEASAAWQAMAGTAYSERIYVGGADAEGLTRPFAEVSRGEGIGVDHFTGHARGTVRVWIEDDVLDAYSGLLRFADADIWFRNRVGPIMSDLIALSRGPGGHLAINGEIQIAGPWRTDEDHEPSEGDSYAVELIIPFGV